MMLFVKNHFNKFYNEGDVWIMQPPAKRLVNITASGELADSFYNGNDPDYDPYSSSRFNYSGNFYLSFPHVLFKIHYGRDKKDSSPFFPLRMEVVFANSMEPKSVYVPPLFNIDSSMAVCIPLSGHFKTLAEVYRYCITAFWQTSFNDGMIDAYSENYSDQTLLGDPRRWHKKTKLSPNWIPSIRSLAYYSTYKRFCEPSLNDDY